MSWISCRRWLRCRLCAASGLFSSPFASSSLAWPVSPLASGFSCAAPSRGSSSESLGVTSRRRLLSRWYHDEFSKQRRFHSSSSRQSFCSFRDTSRSRVMWKGSRSDGSKDRNCEHWPRFPNLRRHQDSGGAGGALTANDLEHNLIWKHVPARRSTGQSHRECLRGQPQCRLLMAKRETESWGWPRRSFWPRRWSPYRKEQSRRLDSKTESGSKISSVI